MAEHLQAFNLKRWIDEHRDLLKPPIGAEMIWKDSQFIVMIIGGPNARRDFHMDPSDEFFYQLEGDMVLEYISAEGKRRRETIRQGDVFLLAANTPHSPQRPANTVGLVVERVRRIDEPESYAWYCERCVTLLYCSVYDTGNQGFSGFWRAEDEAVRTFNSDPKLRTCPTCGAEHSLGYRFMANKNDAVEEAARALF